jgi:hypothetical protein
MKVLLYHTYINKVIEKVESQERTVMLVMITFTG